MEAEESAAVKEMEVDESSKEADAKEMAQLSPSSSLCPYQPGPNAIDCTPEKDGGVLKEILRESDDILGEAPMSGDKVYVHYVGTLAEDGSKFDSSRDRGDHFTFTLGEGQVIKAWDMAVATMKKGELARVTCKSQYAYGSSGSPPKIPPNATLVFEIELFNWHGEDLSEKKDFGITRRTLVKGSGYQTPNDGAMVDINLIGRVNGKVFDERELKFCLGDGEEVSVPEGLETALTHFKKDEKSYIYLKPQYCFGGEGNASLCLEPGTAVEYEVTMRNFEKAKESWELDEKEKVEQAKVFKERGTKYFKEEKYALSVKQYKKIVDFLQHESEGEGKEEAKSLLLAGHLNLSMCFLKFNEDVNAKEHATKALEMDSQNVKAYFRRGQALLNLGEPSDAMADFKKCLELDKNNKAAAQQVQKCANILKAHKEKEKKIYGGMFEKFAREDKKKLAQQQKEKEETSAKEQNKAEPSAEINHNDFDMQDAEADVSAAAVEPSEEARVPDNEELPDSSPKDKSDTEEP